LIPQQERVEINGFRLPACAGPSFAGMSEKVIFRFFTRLSDVIEREKLC